VSTRRLRILHLLSYPIVTGPAEPVLRLACYQRNCGHEVSLAGDTVREGDLIDRAVQMGLPVDRRFALSTRSGPILLMRDLLTFKRLWASGEFDVVHAHRSHDHTLAALTWPERGPTCLIRTLHTERALGRRRRWQLHRADGLVVVAERFRADLLRRGLVPDDRIAVVEGAVDLDRFQPGRSSAVRTEVGIDDHTPVAGIVARMKPDRGHTMLLEIWERVVAHLPTARLLLAGRGELESELRRQVLSRGLGSVTFLGYRRDLPDVYRAFDLSVLLAPGNDGTCRAALEAMACGVPVLACARGALPEIVHDGKTGRVVPADDPAALEQAFVALLSDRANLRRMGAQARDEALARFQIERQGKTIEQLYRRAVAMRRSG
jgi:glycosyltransferase involved in cell wall biosynthesis